MSTDQRLPRFVDYKLGAKLVSERYFRQSPRGLEKWPLQVRIINRRRHVSTDDLIAHAEAKIAAAPAVMATSPLHSDQRDRRKLRLLAIETQK